MSRRLLSLPSVGSGWYYLTLLAATVLMVLAVLAGAAGTADAGSPSEQRKFKSRVEGKFNVAALASGVQVPSGAGFGETVVVAHKCDFSFFTVGNSASAGVQALAEDGSISAFETAVDAAVSDGNALEFWKIDAPTGPTGNKGGPNSIPVDEDFSCLTILVKINPTSDWFAGVSAHDLRAGGTWPTPGNNNHIFIDLFPFDAGTLDGTEFAERHRGNITAGHDRELAKQRQIQQQQDRAAQAHDEGPRAHQRCGSRRSNRIDHRHLG